MDNELVLFDGYGLAEEKRATPVTGKAVFDVGLLSKQITATAIPKLQEQGLLDVTDTLTAFIEDVPPDKASIALRQLLTHSSGSPEYVFDGNLVEIRRVAAVQRAPDASLEFEPGEKYLDSDTG